MKKITTLILLWLAGLLCVLVGLLPLIYLSSDRQAGILSLKSEALRSDVFWNIAFYCHIFFGGAAILVGWTQFFKNFRNKRLRLHRQIGKIYVVSALVSGLSGIYIGFYATGGPIAILGFISVGAIWTLTTYAAYATIKRGDVIRHEQWMIYSFAACFGAVMLRVQSPFILMLTDYLTTYRIIAWTSWAPNLVVAYFLTRKGD